MSGFIPAIFYYLILQIITILSQLPLFFFFWEGEGGEILKTLLELEVHHSLHLLAAFFICAFLESVENDRSYLYGVPFTHSSLSLSFSWWSTTYFQLQPWAPFPFHSPSRVSPSSFLVKRTSSAPFCALTCTRRMHVFPSVRSHQTRLSVVLCKFRNYKRPIVVKPRSDDGSFTAGKSHFLRSNYALLFWYF